MGVYLGRNAVEVYGGGVKVKPEEEKTVTASTSTIEVTPTSGKTLKKVTVNPTPSEEKTVTPSASQQTVSPSAGKMLSKVTVNGDADLIPANIRQGVNIFGVDGKTSVIDTEDIAMLKADKNFNNLIDSTIGDAIRNKNGSTSKLTLDGMVTAINDMASVTIDGVKVTESISLESIINKNVKSTNCPYSFANGSAVVLNGEIHIMGGYIPSNWYTYHYKWNGSSWTSVSTLPFNLYYGEAFVINNEIHILGNTKHYKWNGSSWTSVSTLPYDLYNGAAFVSGNNIHILGSYSTDNSTKHYKWNGSAWTPVSTLPVKVGYATGVMLNNNFHLFSGKYPLSGGTTSSKYHYKWTGSSWKKLKDAPYYIGGCSAVICKNEIHLLGGESSYVKNHYKWNETDDSWIQLDDLPYNFNSGEAVILNESEIHLLGSYDSSAYYNHYILEKFDGYKKVG